jgi:serine protease Do
MRVYVIAALAAASIAAAPRVAMAMSDPAIPMPVIVYPLESGEKARPFRFVRGVIAMKDGQVWGQATGPICDLVRQEFRWNASGTELDVERFAALFNEAVESAGFREPSESNLFVQDAGPSDGLQVAARIIDMKFSVCGSFGYRAKASMRVEWQVFDPTTREVVARIETRGGREEEVSSYSDVSAPLMKAFRENTRALLADSDFRKAIISTGAVASAPTQVSASATPIRLTVARPGLTRPISEVSGSVVALFAGDSMGSGFLVSDDGYMLTNHHVVGSATKVRVRWSDGFETTGDVIRSDKRRDVALVKTEPRARPPLALVRGTPAVGSSVYAVGTPIDASMLNTVTRGIISANRFMDGFAFIQSDVGVNSGNSGGPLLDEKGRVIGITVIKMFPGQGQQNLNLFIPIGDALDFLALKTSG